MHNYEEQRHSARSRCNFVRFLQLMICITCLILSIKNLRYKTLEEICIFLMLINVSSAFTLLVTIDVFSSLFFQFSVHFKLWTIYAFLGTPLFIFCTVAYLCVLSVPATYQTPLMLSFFVLAGLTFFWDGICILFFRKYRITPRNDPSDDEEVVTLKSPSVELVDKCNYLGMAQAAEPASNSSSPRGFPYSGKTTCQHPNRRLHNKRQTIATSYGGTFHVSKNTPPLPSPKVISMVEEAELSVISEKSDETSVKCTTSDQELQKYLYLKDYDETE